MGMREEMKVPLSMLSISYLNKLKYKGSYNGKRFMFEKSDDKLNVYLWKDIFSFENTDKKDITMKTFSYDETGIDLGIKFVEEASI